MDPAHGSKSSLFVMSSPVNGIWLKITFWIGLTLLSFLTRFYNLGTPWVVVWDETHFLKHISWYLEGRFFFDVHPPLGKLTFAAFASILEDKPCKPAFQEPGASYEPGDSLIWHLRALSATFGALTVPVGSLIACRLSSHLAGLLAAILLLFDTALITPSQYVLLDSQQLFYQLLTVLFFVESRKNKWFLLPTAVAVFAVCSVKLSGVFTALLVGLSLLHEHRGSLPALVGQGGVLVTIPAILYLGLFWVHLEWLPRSGSGDGFFSGPFQAALIGSPLADSVQTRFLHHQATLTLKNAQTGGSYLHSHSDQFPDHFVEGVQQNTTEAYRLVYKKRVEVTGYSHRDRNNKWVLLGESGSWLLRHAQTGLFLAVFDAAAPLRRSQLLVGAANLNQSQFYSTRWSLRGVSGEGVYPRDIHTQRDHFQLWNPDFHCHLRLNHRALPSWAFEQHEVTCASSSDIRSHWLVEENFSPGASTFSLSELRPSFPGRFLESHLLMLSSNNGLRPREGQPNSRPRHWPLNPGQLFAGRPRIRLRGNAAIWGLDLALLLAFPILHLVTAAIAKRRRAFGATLPSLPDERSRSATLWLWRAWLLHYLPYTAMHRMLYAHHYLPALLFSSLLSACLLSSLLKMLSRRMQVPAVILIGAIAVEGWLRALETCYGV